jgi:hypothetical protein
MAQATTGYAWTSGEVVTPAKLNQMVNSATVNNIQAADIAGITATGSTTARTLPDRFADTINVKDFGAVGNGVADDTAAIQAAVSHAFNGGYALYWGGGSYRTTSSITNLHRVAHSGTAAIVRGTNTFSLQPQATSTNILYCAAAAPNDNGDGLSASEPIQQIRTAAAYLGNYRHVIGEGQWEIRATAGAYKGQILVPSGLVTKNYIKIIGTNGGASAGSVIDLSLNRQGASGTFSTSETITGGTSGAVATIQSIKIAAHGTSVGSQIALVVSVTSGTFAEGETITGSTSGATATLSRATRIPLTIIDKAQDAAATRGFLAIDKLKVWLENVKVVGAFSISETISRNTVYQRRNVHIDGPSVGIDIDNLSTYFVTGGILENCALYAVVELFSVVRDFVRDPAPQERVLIRNCDLGFLAKENCSGHLDSVAIEDCGTAVVFHAYTTSNVRLMQLRRNATGFVIVNSELHNDTSVNFGSGADATPVRLLPFGCSSQITEFGWVQSNGNITLRTGYQPMVPLRSSYTTVVHTGTTSATDVFVAATVLRAGRYSVRGRKCRVVVTGTTTGTLAANAIITIRLASIIANQVVIPAGAVSQSWRVEMDAVSVADGGQLLCSAVLIGNSGTQDVQNALRTIDLASQDRSVVVQFTLGNASDTCTLLSAEVFG